ncbi:MAG: (2Fe-2S)-binding protein, partial [Nitrospinota bacterium]
RNVNESRHSVQFLWIVILKCYKLVLLILSTSFFGSKTPGCILWGGCRGAFIMAAKRMLTFTLNGEAVEVLCEPNRSVAEVLREDLGMTGTKTACDMGVCGSCSVLMDGALISGCLTLALRCRGKSITTVEGIGNLERGLDPLQQAFIAHGATQCGYCTPGMIVAARALLAENPTPTEEEVRHYLAGNLCRCTGYARIVQAVLAAAEGRTEPKTPALSLIQAEPLPG